MARRSDHTRKELEALILDKTWDMVGRGGFDGLTARKIGEAVGYAPGTLYNVFGTLDDLYLAVNARTLDRLYEVLSGSCVPGELPVMNMKAMAADYRRFCQSRRPYWLMLFSHHLPPEMDVPQWYRDKIERLFQPLEHLLTPYYASDEKGRRMAARILWSSVHGLCFLEQTGKFDLAGHDMTVGSMIDTLIDTFMKGIKD